MSLDVSTISYPQYEYFLNFDSPTPNPESFLAKSFADRVRLVNSATDPLSTYLVDASVYARGPNLAAREKIAGTLETAKKSAKRRANFSAVLIVGGAAGAVSGFCLSALPLTILGIVGVAAGSFALYSYNSEANRLQKLEDAWKTHPAQKVVDERTRSYKEGFPYVRSQNLKGVVGTIGFHNMLHPIEVTNLYERSLKTTFAKAKDLSLRSFVSDKDMKEWVKKMVQEDLLSKEAIQYAYGTISSKTASETLSERSPLFKTFKKDWSELKKSSSQKILKVQSETSEAIQGIKNKRDFAISAASLIRENSDAQAKKTYEAKLASALTAKEQDAALLEYKNALSQHESLYLLAIAPIHLIADNAIEKEIEKQNAKIEEIYKWESSWTQHLFQKSLNLFQDTYLAAFDSVKAAI